MKTIVAEECPHCDDGLIKDHEVLENEKKLLCLSCGHKQKYEVM